MRCARIEVRNFRSLRDVTIECDRLTALIGRNGTGKSNIMRALEFFFGETVLDDMDCWSGDARLPIEVSLTFTDLPQSLQDDARAFVDQAACLRVTRRSVVRDAVRVSEFVALRKQGPGFGRVRQAANATDVRVQYEKLQETELARDLPPWKSFAQARSALDEWEDQHAPDLSEEEDVGSITYHGGGVDLSRYVRRVFVPAVRDAAEESVETRATAFGELIDLLVAPALPELVDQLQKLESETQSTYSELIGADGVDALRRAQEALTKRLQTLVPTAAIELEWDPRPPTVQVPKARAKLREGGFAADVGRQGHGVQRAYLLALLQLLAEQRDRAAEVTRDQMVLLVIEEPELFQHPVQARLMARVLQELSVTDEAQVVYATHSPLFVSLEGIEALRLFRLIDADVPDSVVSQVDLDAAALQLWQACGAEGRAFSAATLKPRLRALSDPHIAEGFFANAVVLVEGPEDIGFIRGAAAAAGVDCERKGIAVVAVGGKTSLDRPYLVFSRLGIPTYLVFDGDEGHEAPTNRRLLCLLGSEQVDAPPTFVAQRYAVFSRTLAHTVRAEVGDVEFDQALEAAREEFGFSGEDTKNPYLVEEAIRILDSHGCRSPTLAALVRAIDDLVPG